ncbi:MAG: LPS export ABC transporter permease LptF [Alphaproteobacteria bacterium]
MMLSLNRYILRQMVLALLLVLGCLTVAVWLAQALRFLELTVDGGAPLNAFVLLAVLTLPKVLRVGLPLSLVIALSFVYNHLQQDSELVVLRAAGASHLQIALPGMALTLCVAALVFWMSALLAPQAEIAFEQERDDLRAEFSTAMLREGSFTVVARDVTVYVRERQYGGDLRGIIIHDTRDAQENWTIMAKRGLLTEADAGPRLIVYDGVRQQKPAMGEENSTRIAELAFKRYTIDLNLLDRTKRVKPPSADELTLTGLLDRMAEPDLRDKDRAKLRGEFHQRLTRPLYVMAFGAMVMCVLLAGAFSRRGQGRKLGVLAIGVVLLQVAQIGFASLSERNGWAIPLVWLGAIGPLVACMVHLIRAQRDKSPAEEALA